VKTEREQQLVSLPLRTVLFAGRRVRPQIPIIVFASRLRVFAIQATLLAAGFLLLNSGWAQQKAAADKPFQDEPAARALYTEMVKAMREATTLSWVSDYRWEARGQTLGHAIYHIWLGKPNYARLEACKAGETEPSGILVGDGDYFWTYWPKQKPRYGWESAGKYGEEYEKHKRTFYMKHRTPVGRHSISHEVGQLGAGMCMTIIDPSIFHGYSDSLQPYLDGVRGSGTEKIGDEVCDQVEVSLMKHQRSWYLWLARKDHLPRKLKEIVRVSNPITAEESWSAITINAEIPHDRFVWSAPPGWQEWRFPAIEEGLLKPGTQAPDFDLAAVDGARIKLSNFRGQVVWLNKWRCG
jgi:outer membrane lipoprotein-sorting protein